MPAAAAARAAQRSPSGQKRPARPVGPIITGSDRRLPNRSTDRSRVAAPSSGCGRRAIGSKAASLRRRVTSSSAPPSAKSKTGLRQCGAGEHAHGVDGIAAPLPAGSGIAHREVRCISGRDPGRIAVIVPGRADPGIDRDGGAGDAGRNRRVDEGNCRGDIARASAPGPADAGRRRMRAPHRRWEWSPAVPSSSGV